MPCRAHWLQLQQHQSELERLGVRVCVVTFDDKTTARAYVEKNQLEWPLLIDAQRAFYAQFGMGRASMWTLIKPSTIWSYIVLWLKGVKPQKAGSDMHQLGGDVLIAPDGTLRLNHVSTGPHDRPGIGSLLDLIRGEMEPG